jgi:PAS domain S-box-containing protein
MGITTLARPMSLRSQLVAALAVVGATILVLGAVAYGMAQAVIQDAAAVEDADAVLASLAGVGTAMEAMQTADARILATRSTGAFAAFARAGDELAGRLDELANVETDEPDRARIARMRALLAQWLSSTLDQRDGPTLAPASAADVAAAHVEPLRRLLGDAVAAEQSELKSQVAASRRAAAALPWVILGVTFGGVLAAVGAFGILVRRLSAAATAIMDGVEAFADGDLDRRIELDRHDELGRLANRINAVVDRLARTIQDLRSQQQQTRLAERQACEQLALTRAILEATPDGIVVLDHTGKPLLTNRRLSELIGVTATQSRDVGEFFARADEVFEDVAPVRELAAQALAHPEEEIHTTLIVRAPRRELAVTSKPVRGDDGEVLGRLILHRDVTREREVDRMKTEFVSLVSHELRTPLTSIKGYVDLLLDGDVGAVSDEQGGFLRIVKNNADRLVALINDLLDVSRIEAGKVELRLAPLDVATIVGQVASSLVPQLEAKGQTLRLDLPDDLPLVSADADRVAQVVTNLLSNAHKYTPAGGRIEVTAHRDGARVVVEVRDRGIGMSEDELGKLFTKFYRATNRTTEQVGGTGLGLTIAKSLVEMHGGTIGVESAPGAGTTFAFTLPVAGAASSAAAPSAPAAASRAAVVRSGARVLVVEDEPDIAQLIRRYLQRGGYGVLIASDGAEGLRLARDEQPDVITLDVLMPGVDGLTVLEWLKSDPTTAGIPVVLLSIVPDDGRAARLGAVDYLNKPVDPDVLLAHVARVLEQPNGRTVLVADDDDRVRRLIGLQLAEAGYAVLDARDGAEAVEAARRARPDLVLLDVGMPGRDGISALRTLRQDPQTRCIPVALMTALPNGLRTDGPVLAGLDVAALLTKPFTVDELAGALAAALGDAGVRPVEAPA